MCADYPGILSAGATVSVQCDPETLPARYVVVQTPGTGSIGLCEVEVYTVEGNNNNNLRLFDCRHTAQSNTTNIHRPGRDTQQSLYTEGLSDKRQTTKENR